MRKDVYPHMDFEQYIADRLSKGASVEDLAKEMTDTLNKKQKELAKAEEARETIYTTLIDGVNEAIDTDNPTFETAARLAAAYAAREYKNWDVDTINAFIKEAADILKTTAAVADLRAHSDPFVQTMDKMMEEIFGIPAPTGAPVKARESSPKENETSDKVKINRFLQKMGW